MNVNDPLDVAYLAIGAKAGLADAPCGTYHALSDALGGELGIISAAVDLFPMLERLWDEVEGEFDGVWAYEVCEPLGRWYIGELLEGRHDADAEAHARQLIQDR